MVPKLFLAEYECENCGELLEMTNCYVPWFSTYCDECDEISVFFSARIEHLSWEWDTIED